MNYNFANALCDAARIRPSQTFVIVDENEQYSYAEVRQRAAAAAETLAGHGVSSGSRVGIRLTNTIDFIPYYFGLLSLGAVVFLLNPSATAREFSYVVNDGNLDLVIVEEADVIRTEVSLPCLSLGSLVATEAMHMDTPLAPVQLDPSATAVVLYTSGSTGSPKGVELSHQALILGPLMNAVATRSVGGEIVYAVLPLYHVYGITELINACVVLGNTIVLHSKFRTKDLLDAIEQFKITMLPAVPTMLHAVINADLTGRNLGSVRQIASGGAPISPDHINKVRQAFPNASYVEGYGLTETAALGTQNGPQDFRFGSVGRAVQGLDVRIFGPGDVLLEPGVDNVGEIAIRGLGLMKGYLGRPEETARSVRGGWFFTGDLGFMDADGFLFITGRSKDLIIRGGFNVYPVEVEHVLESHQSVSQAAVVGIPHEHYGEEVAAFIVPAEGQAFSAEDLCNYAKAKLSAYKYPRHIFAVAELPVGATGKIDKPSLRLDAARFTQ